MYRFYFHDVLVRKHSIPIRLYAQDEIHAWDFLKIATLDTLSPTQRGDDFDRICPTLSPWHGGVGDVAYVRPFATQQRVVTLTIPSRLSTATIATLCQPNVSKERSSQSEHLRLSTRLHLAIVRHGPIPLSTAHWDLFLSIEQCPSLVDRLRNDRCAFVGETAVPHSAVRRRDTIQAQNCC